MTAPAPILLAVDGNSLAHRAFHALAASGLRTSDGRASWAVKGFMSLLLSVVERVGPSAVVVGFDDPTGSVRRTAYAGYKATRKPKPPELGEQIAGIGELLREAGVHVVTPGGLEADDVLASAAATAAAAGWRCVIATSDRDSFALISDTTSVLRILNGGVDGSPLLTPDRLVTMYGVRPEQYQLYAAIRGDSSDNLPGIVGVGEKTAAKLLASVPDTATLLADLDSGAVAVTAAAGKAAGVRFLTHRPALERNLEIMAMYTDVPLGLNLTAPGAGLLPLPADALTAALAGWELHSVNGRAAQLLAGRSAPAPAAAPLWDDLPAAPPLWDDHLTASVSSLDREPGVAPAARPTSGAMPGSILPRPDVWPVTL